eukprot:CAMPEP_0117472536 /NCGR_PEP_ID=MMETSP0784-20121206/8297_1 /TAXON_ID=39447 /ORGANISM="" /LENGTH=187 /DNA_ID=CAMNT_0005266689 /DNA_START=115 /DNA_END=679 /DNA_ORIENTATION=-
MPPNKGAAGRDDREEPKLGCRPRGENMPPNKGAAGAFVPVMRTMFRDPVIVPEAGRTFEREGIESFWKKIGRPVDPLSNRTLKRRELFTNWDKRSEIQSFLDQYPNYMPEGWEDRQVPSASQDLEEGDCGATGTPEVSSASEPRHFNVWPVCLERRPIARRLISFLATTLLMSQLLVLLRLQLEHLG